jgi:hypothetical protein
MGGISIGRRESYIFWGVSAFGEGGIIFYILHDGFDIGLVSFSLCDAS